MITKTQDIETYLDDTLGLQARAGELGRNSCLPEKRLRALRPLGGGPLLRGGRVRRRVVQNLAAYKKNKDASWKS